MSKLCGHSGLVTWALASLFLSVVGCSSDKGNGGSNGASCTQGATRECVGPGACVGAQFCQDDKVWSACDCGTSGAGGGSGTGGNSSTAATTSSTDIGGSTSATGGSTSVAAGGTTDATGGGGIGSTSTGGAASSATGGMASTPTGGASAATGGVTSTLAGGATAGPTGGVTSVTTGGAAHAGGTSSTGGSSSQYLVSDKGWVVDPAHNIEGPLFTYVDDGGSEITPDCVSDTCFESLGTTTSLCVSGIVAQALDSAGYDCEATADYCDWETYWGAAMAINPNQSATATEPSAWDASGYTGITFKSTVDAMPPNLRIYLNTVGGKQFCYNITSSKTYTLTWSQFRADCYTTGGASPSAADLADIKSISWQAGTNASNAGVFDFCIADVKITP